MCIYTLFYFYDANCFSQGDMVKLAYPHHSAGKMKAKLTVQNIDERDLWHRHQIENSISLAKDLVYIGGVCPVAVLFQKSSSSPPYAVPILMSKFHTEIILF